MCYDILTHSHNKATRDVLLRGGVRHILYIIKMCFALKGAVLFCVWVVSRDSSVDIVTRLWAGRFGVRSPAGARDFSSLGFIQPHVQWVPGFFDGAKAARGM